MSEIEKIDKNFAVNTADTEDMIYFSCTEKPFRLYGISAVKNGFERMPGDIAQKVNDGVKRLNTNTAGGRVRFMTDSEYISIRAKMTSIGKMPHFALTGSAGFDLYSDNNYIGTFVPPFNISDGYESKLMTGISGMHLITLDFPLYSSVSSLDIGLCAGAQLSAPADYRITRPVVYYGSSITQGGCASRPGNSYESIISRELDCDYINLGFSGSAHGEKAMAEYIAGLDMSAFVLDYDHNSPGVQHLESTHYPMYQTVRRQNPDVPVIMLSRPQSRLNDEEKRRRDVILKTYLKARGDGDSNVYFIDGGEILNIFGGDSGTVDNCHPNDLGFMCMAKAIGAVLKKVL